MNPSASRAASRVRARLKRNLLEGASRLALALALVPALNGIAAAGSPPVLPQGGTFKAGTPGAVPFDTSVAGQLAVNQASQRAVIDWQSFSIGAGGKVQINNGSGATLNRVTGGNLSSIMGDLRGTGSVYLINPQGVVIGQGGTVVTGGTFVASTLDIPNAAFMAGGDMTFTGQSTAIVQNSGTITSTSGDVMLIARTVSNDGSISAPMGTAGLAAGTQVLLRETTGSEKVFVQAPGGDLTNSGVIAAAQAELKAAGGNIYALAGNNGGAIRATGTQTIDGHVWLTADGGGSLYNDGAIGAQNADGSGGAIALAAAQGTVSSSGVVSVSGTAGGSVTIKADRVIQQGKLTADASTGNGGQIATTFTSAYIDTQFALTSAGGNIAGSISVTGLPADPNTGLAGGSLFSSGTFRANGWYAGGSIALTASSMHFAAAQISASGYFGGGSIRIGGDFHGGGTLPLAGDIYVNPMTALSADATLAGNGGSVVVWAQNATTFGGMSSAVGGPEGGQGGQREISSANTLTYAGRESTAVGDHGSLLLDPAFVVIDNTGKAFATGDLVDPAPAANNQFGHSIVNLSGGNIVVTAPGTNTNAGAAYLFSGTSGALISTITGTTTGLASSVDGSGVGDRVGEEGIVALANGNFVVQSDVWNNSGASAPRAGAVTFGNGTTGFTGGTVSSSNSLVGSHSNDLVGNQQVLALSTGNYVVPSSAWMNPGIGSLPDAAGAATFGNGTTGVTGVVSASNSLIGVEGQGGIDLVGSEVGQRLVALSNGNYVIGSPIWNHGQGAATFGNGTTGNAVGLVSSSNSLVGDPTHLTTQGCPSCGDLLGQAITALSDGNYVVSGPGGSTAIGVKCYVNVAGNFNLTGAASIANSFHGTNSFDQVGFGSFEPGITALANGNYVITSPLAKIGGNANAGAVTLIKPSGNFSNTTGTPSAANSLIGGDANDFVGGGDFGAGGVYVLTNGNYVVASPNWGPGGSGQGAATFINVASPTVGAVSASNSLVGAVTTSEDAIASGAVELNTSDPNLKAIVPLTNGNYVVVSPFWDNGCTGASCTANFAGAVTLMSGTTGLTVADGLHTISAANSLVGSQLSDLVGGGGVVALANGAYGVSSPNWANGATKAVGAITIAPATGIVGAVSTSNSMVGTKQGDQVGGGSSGGIGADGFSAQGTRAGGILALASGNVVVASPFWTGTAAGGPAAAGAVTFVNGTTPASGTVSSANSLVGANAGDNLGAGSVNGIEAGIGIIVSPLGTGDYAVLSPGFNSSRGAVTIGKGTGGTVGTISTSNSLIGNVANAGLSTVGFIPTGPNAGALFAGFQTDQGFQNGTSFADGRVTLAIVNPNLLTFGALPGQTVTVVPAFLTSSLDAGVDVTIHASKDITINSAVTETAGGAHGSLTLDAGRSIIVNAGISTDNGNLTLTANDPASPDAASTAAAITIGSSAPITTGTGDLTIKMLAGANTSGTTSIGSVLSANHILVQSTGAVTLASGGKLAATATSSTAVQVVAGGAFTNSASLGAGAITTGAGGHWLIWSQNPANDTLGGLAFDYKQYNATFGTTTPLGTGNGILYTLAPMLAPTVTGNISKQYDGTTAATVAAGQISATGIVTGDTVTFNLSGATYDNKNVGTGKTVTATGITIASATTTAGGKPIFGYQLASTSGSGAVGTIIQAPLTVTAVTDTKTYDGNTSSTATPMITGTVFAGDTANFSEVFDSKNAGPRTLSIAGAVNDGNSGNNYLVTTATANGLIQQKDITASLQGTVSKGYDATTAATIAVGNYLLNGAINGDIVTVSNTGATYDTKNVGTGKTVTVTGLLLGGADASNYILSGGSTISGAVGTITAKTLTAGLTGTVSKTYDGTTGATLAAGNYTLPGVFAGDTVTLNDPTTGSYDTKDVGVGKTVSVTALAISGADAGDYTLSSTSASAAIGTITQKAITASLQGTVSKTYDATTAAALAGSNYALSGVVAGDTVSVSNTSGSYDTKNVGVGKTVTVNGLALTGGSAQDYSLSGTTVSGAVGTITPAALTVTAVTNTKTNDGNTSSVAVPMVTGLLGTDSSGFSEVFDSKNAGARTLSPTGVANDGNGGNNYIVTPVSVAGLIQQKLLTAALQGNVSKTYDGTTSATLTAANYALPGVVGGDAITVTNTSGTYDTANVGINKTVTVNGLTLGGGSAGNYALTSMTVSGAVGTITQAPLTIAALDASTILGQPLPTFSANITGFVHNETSSVLSGSLAFAVPAAALAQPGIFPIVPGGVSAANYAITFVDGNLTVTGVSNPLPPIPVTITLPPPDFTIVTTDLTPGFGGGGGNSGAGGNSGGGGNAGSGGNSGNGGNPGGGGGPGNTFPGVNQGGWLYFGTSFGEVSGGGSDNGDDKDKGKGNGKGNGSANASPTANIHG
jgi:trimeric autotransporter adhesin